MSDRWTARSGKVIKASLASDTRRVACICGEDFVFSSSLIGRIGRCPACGRRLRVPGTRREALARSLPSQHAMFRQKVDSMDTNFAPHTHAFYVSQLDTFVAGGFHLTAWTFLVGIVDASGTGGTPLPKWPPALGGLWALATYLLASLAAVPVAAVFRRRAGSDYASDRRALALAGGYDIVRWVPLVAVAVVTALFRVGRDSTVWPWLSALASPWIGSASIAIGTMVLSIFVARRVFGARFGRGSGWGE